MRSTSIFLFGDSSSCLNAETVAESVGAMKLRGAVIESVGATAKRDTAPAHFAWVGFIVRMCWFCAKSVGAPAKTFGIMDQSVSAVMLVLALW